MKRFLLVLSVLLTSLLGFTQGFSSKAPDHAIWTEILQKNVAENGAVNYKGILAEREKFDQYIDVLTSHHPHDGWSSNEQLAYWINAYNAFTVKLIVDNYPVKSIKELGGKIYKVNTPWDIKFIVIEGEKYDLNNIEHGIIRKQFAEPRIHFAVNCASSSCPALRNEAFTAEKLEVQLEEQASAFVNDTRKNKIAADHAELSKIFSWFKGDFNKESSVIDFINKYSKVKLTDDTKIEFQEYLWDLNE
jgi:hypothetical protein